MQMIYFNFLFKLFKINSYLEMQYITENQFYVNAFIHLLQI